MTSITNSVSDRMVYVRNRLGIRELKALRCRTSTIWDAYSSFPFKDELSFSSFYKYISKEFKKPYRQTDLCDYCLHGKKLKNQLISDAIKFEFEDLSIDSESFDSQALHSFFNAKYTENNEEIAIIIARIDEFQEIEFHQSVAKRQRNCYNADLVNKELLKSSIIIDMDFKQKIVIGMGPQQVSSDYYDQQQRALFGFGIYYLDHSSNKIPCINFDVVSENLKQDALAVVQCFRFLRKQKFFVDVEKNNYIIWADCGSHFRCSELAHYLFKELAEEKKIVNLNFFCEKHGKNRRDQHFSNVDWSRLYTL